MRGARIPESVIHRQCAALLNGLNVLWLHVPNEGRRSPVTGARLKALGMRAGFPDFLIIDRPPLLRDRCGMAIELKAQGGRLTTKQRWWIEALNARGYEAVVAVGYDEFARELRRAGYLTRVFV